MSYYAKLINWKVDQIQRKQLGKLAKNKYKEYEDELKQQKVSMIIDSRPIRESYPEWRSKTLEIRDKFSSKRKIRKKWKVERILTKEKRRVNKLLKKCEDKEQIAQLKLKKETICDLIDEEQRSKQFTRINKVISFLGLTLGYV